MVNEFPCLLGNAERTNHIEEELMLPLVKLWTVKIVEEVSAPVVSNGVVYIRTKKLGRGWWVNRQLEAYDLNTGELKWTYGFDKAERSYNELCVFDDIVVLQDEGCLWGIKDGQLLWKTDKQEKVGGSGWPTVHKGLIVVDAYWWNIGPMSLSRGELQIINPYDGRIVRTANVAMPGTPACHDNYIVVVSRENRKDWVVKCFDFESMELLWESHSILTYYREGYADYPMIKDGKVYAPTAGGLHCLELKTGKVIWAAKAFGSLSCTKDKIISTDDMLQCFNAQSGSVLYLKKEEELNYIYPPSSLSIGRHILWPGKRLHILNEDSCEIEQIFKPNLGSFVRNIVYAEGRVLFCKFRGYLYCLGPKSLKPKKMKDGG